MRMINNSIDYFQIHRMTDNIPSDFPIITSEEDALKYLYFLDQTLANSSSIYDIFDYELIIYIELFFQNNEEIQQLLTNIKANIYHDFIIKHKYIKRLTDDLCKCNLPKLPYDNYRYRTLGIKKEEKINEKI